jgi:gluconate 5-dehydrogenase
VLDQFALSGRVALVTGSARGLGYEIARGMAAAGARVYVNGTDAGRLQRAVERLGERGVAVSPACFDVADEPLAAEWIERIHA